MSKRRLIYKGLYKIEKKINFMDIFKNIKNIIMEKYFIILMKDNKVWHHQVKNFYIMIFYRSMNSIKY